MDFILVLVILFGLVIGSFLNVVGLRLLREEEFVKKSSYCYHCNHKLSWTDLIPVVSYVLLGGQCRYCKAKVSWQYPAVELLTAGLFAAVYLVFGLTWQSLLLAWLMMNMVVILITDFREEYIFDINSIGLIPAGLIYSALFGWENLLGPAGIGLILLDSVLSIAVAWIIFKIPNLLSKLVFKAEGFGEGDVRLIMGIGSYFGVIASVLVFVMGLVLQSIMAIPYMVFKWVLNKEFKLVGAFTGAFLFAIGPHFIRPTLIDMGIELPVILTCVVLAAVFGFLTISLMRNSEGSYTMMPLGPSLCLGVIIYVFVLASMFDRISYFAYFQTIMG